MIVKLSGNQQEVEYVMQILINRLKTVYVGKSHRDITGKWHKDGKFVTKEADNGR